MNIKELQTTVKVLKEVKETEKLPITRKVALDSIYDLFNNLCIDAEKAKVKGSNSPVIFRLRVDI